MEIICVEVSCPLFNFENGPFSFSDKQLEDISEKYCCPLETVKYCARTNPHGYIHEDEDRYFRICRECTGYGDDYYFNEEGELTCACPDCWVTKEKEEKNG